MNSSKKIKILAATIFLGASASLWYGVSLKFKSDGILAYEEARDKKDILSIFESDWHWLISSPDYDPVFMLDNRAPNAKEPRYFGALEIKVLREHGQFIGFVTYYKKNFYEGFILFLAIKPELRGKRYAEKLIQYAEGDLKKMGIHVIHLVTRTTNHRAQALYRRTGYHEVGRDDEFVFFEKWV